MKDNFDKQQVGMTSSKLCNQLITPVKGIKSIPSYVKRSKGQVETMNIFLHTQVSCYTKFEKCFILSVTYHQD